ncbi:MAG: TadE family protein [Planctomycetota bacterium]
MNKLRSRSKVMTKVKKPRRRAARRAERRRGAALVEFAIVSNLLFLLVMTCIDFARLNMVRNLSQDAAYYAARQAMVPGATKQEAEDLARNIMSAMVASGVDVSVSDLDQNSSEITVRVDVNLNSVALISSSFFPSPILSTEASMRTERYSGFFRQ